MMGYKPRFVRIEGDVAIFTGFVGAKVIGKNGESPFNRKNLMQRIANLRRRHADDSEEQRALSELETDRQT